MTIAFYWNFIERGCSMTERSLMDILPQQLLYVYIADFTATQANLPEFMVLSAPLGAPRRLIHSKNDEPYMLEDEARVSGIERSLILHKHITLLDESSAYHNQFINVQTQLENNFHGYFGSIKMVQHRAEL